MAGASKIEWTDSTWNPIRARCWEIQDDGSGKERVGWHCEHVSEGCRNCYAEGINLRLGTGFEFKPGNLRGKPGYHGGGIDRPELFLDETMLLAPLRWKRPRMIFVCSMTDLFAEFVPDEWIDRMFAVMALCPQHTFQVLTKRAERMRKYFAETWQPAPARDLTIAGELYHVPAEKRPGDRWDQINLAMDDIPLPDQDRFWTPAGSLIGRPVWPRKPLPNVWLGVSAERQQEADERIPLLLQTPAAVRFISAEPLLGPIDLTWIAEPDETRDGVIDALLGCNWIDGQGCGATYRPSRPGHQDRQMTREVVSVNDAKLDWVIVGGESGPNARPMHPDWARSLRDQCAAASVAFFFKQWGEWLPGEANRGQFDPTPMHAYRRCDDHGYDWPEARAVQNFGTHVDPWSGDLTTRRVGKKRAGRLLDGKEHNEMPAIAAARAHAA